MILVLNKCFRRVLLFLVVVLSRRRDGLMNVVVDDGAANMTKVRDFTYKRHFCILTLKCYSLSIKYKYYTLLSNYYFYTPFLSLSSMNTATYMCVCVLLLKPVLLCASVSSAVEITDFWANRRRFNTYFDFVQQNVRDLCLVIVVAAIYVTHHLLLLLAQGDD